MVEYQETFEEMTRDGESLHRTPGGLGSLADVLREEQAI